MLLFIIAIILFALIVMPSVTLACVHVKKLDGYLGDIAYCIDMLGQVIGQYLWNLIFIKSGSDLFGVRGFTISHVLASNYYYDEGQSLTKFGLWMCKLLIKKGDTAFKN